MFATALERVQQLVHDFKQNENIYLQPEYSEAQTRVDFIDKFFDALGWDVYHNQQKNPYAQEVKVERGVLVGKRQKRADYAFFIRPDFQNVRFFAEAKKPARRLRNADDYFQTIRYGWNAETPVAILTDFEEFHVLDCRFIPDIDTALDRCLQRLHYTQYADEEHFSLIYYLFSRGAVENGSLEEYSKSLPQPIGGAIQRGLFKGGYQAIDETFLRYLNELRLRLARGFKSTNPKLTSSQLTEATQRTIDRLIFIRFLEDRLIEPEPIISELGTNASIWSDFVRTCKRLDAKYNGIVFREHFTDRDRFNPPPPGVFIEICSELSHYNTPYDFNSIPIHILGAIYEQFLGSVIIANDKQVLIEQKPEVRHAGGVYYTPSHIVQYIIDKTVGRKIEGKTPGQIANIKFADISCGSGSFLIGAYQKLLQYHTEYYQSNPEKAKKDGCIFADGRWVLSLHQKREILTNSIYGVDIDHQAVEVAQLSLFLKLLEDETTATANEMLVLFKERILPDLSSNVVSGNTLIGYEFVQGDIFEDEIARVNPMDFDDAFPSVMQRGGFDAVIGNPPYVRIQTLRQEAPQDVGYYNRTYMTAGRGNYDIYLLFVEKGLAVLNDDGVLGYILPHKFFTAQYGRGLRKLLGEGRHIEEVVHFEDQQVFKDATTYTCLLFLSKRQRHQFAFSRVRDLKEWQESRKAEHAVIKSKRLSSDDWNIPTGPAARIYEKLNQQAEGASTMKDMCEHISQGIRTSANTVYVLDILERLGDDRVIANSESLNRPVELETGLLKPFLSGDEIKAFQIKSSRKAVIIPYCKTDNGHSLIPEEELEALYPLTFRYLIENKHTLEQRERGRMKGEGWYGYVYPKNLDLMQRPKILVPDIADRANFALDDTGAYAFTSGYGITLNDNVEESIHFVLGLLNSAVLDFYIRVISTPLRGGFFRYFTKYIEKLPIPRINFQEKEQRRLHNQVVEAAKQISEAKMKETDVLTDKNKALYHRMVQGAYNRLNEAAYILYQFDEDDVSTVNS